MRNCQKIPFADRLFRRCPFVETRIAGCAHLPPEHRVSILALR